MRNRNSSPTIEPTIESSRAPIEAKTKSTEKSLAISESRIWHRQLVHLNPTTKKALIDAYPQDDSMCTVCIQTKHKQLFMKVPVQRTTKPI